MSVEVPSEHVKPGDTSQLLVSLYYDNHIDCLRLMLPPEEPWVVLASHCYELPSFSWALLWICFLPVVAFVACQMASGAPDAAVPRLKRDLGKLLPAGRIS